MKKENEQLQKDVNELKEKVLYLTEILEKAGLIDFIEKESVINMRFNRE